MKDAARDMANGNKRTFSYSEIASGVALLLSIISLFVSVMELSSLQKQQRANVWPYLQITSSYTQAGFSIELQNKGVGPAILSGLVLSYDGKRYKELDAMIRATVGDEDAFSYDVYQASNPSNSVIATSENIRLFAVPWEARTKKLIEKWDTSADISICYCSIHDECWETSLSKEVNRSVKVC